MTRHLIDIESLPDRAAEALVERAVQLADGAPARRLDGQIVHLFWEPSTRTRVSFELAALRLGLGSVHIDPGRSSATKGESLEDTVRTLAAMRPSALVVRHSEAGIPARIQGWLSGSGVTPSPAIINAGDGARAHPTQALLDAATLAREGIDWPNVRLALLGDLRHSRVARSAFALYRRLGVVDLRMAGPPTLMPEADDPAFAGVTRFDGVDAALAGATVVGCLRIQRERIRELDLPDDASYHQAWGLTEARAAGLDAAVRILHPGPVNRGIEIASSVADGPNSRILSQVEMGVALRTAVFEWLFRADAGTPRA